MTTNNKSSRSEARCVYINDPLWLQVRQLAKENSLSVSSYIRLLIKQQHQDENKSGLTDNKKSACLQTVEETLINSTQ